MRKKVTRVAGWAGWCTPCQSEDRPLVLTRSGPAGLRAWWDGADDGGQLLLTCGVCGQWQVVPASEEDDPEVVLTEVSPVVEAPTPPADRSQTPPLTIDLTDDVRAPGADAAAAAAALSDLATSTADSTPPPVGLRTS